MPDTMIDPATITNAVQLASRAPSLHNTQPWRWVADADGLKLFLDPNRVVYSTDRSAREAVISCGAMLDHVRVAMAAAGWGTTVERFPNPNNLDHLATLHFREMEFVTDAHRRRAEAILARRTDRLPMTGYAAWDSFEPVLRAQLAGGPVHLDVLSDDVRPDLAEAVALTESLRLYDSAYHADLTWWTTPFATEDGIPQSSLVSAEESDRVSVSRAFPVTRHSERRRHVNDDSATIVVLSTDGYSRADALECGEALSAALLECTLAGLSTCPVTHVTELHASRDIIGTLIGRDACPQVLLRIGTAPGLEEVPPPTARRPVEAFLSFA
ncbi:Acg family FMN-binding oxidoreductase [Mycolicibacterium sp. XJ870]